MNLNPELSEQLPPETNLAAESARYLSANVPTYSDNESDPDSILLHKFTHYAFDVSNFVRLGRSTPELLSVCDGVIKNMNELAEKHAGNLSLDPTIYIDALQSMRSKIDVDAREKVDKALLEFKSDVTTLGMSLNRKFDGAVNSHDLLRAELSHSLVKTYAQVRTLFFSDPHPMFEPSENPEEAIELLDDLDSLVAEISVRVNSFLGEDEDIQDARQICSSLREAINPYFEV
jgi:hypothetical protein